MNSVEIKGKRVNTIDLNPQGDAPIVMVHGLYSSLGVFYFQIAPVLAKRHRVILYDLRSHGMSEVRNEGYTLDILCDDLLCLMDEMGLTKAHIVGHSFGGSVALYTALTHPDRVNRLALIEGSLLREPPIMHMLSGKDDEQAMAYALEEYSKSTRIRVTDQVTKRMLRLQQIMFDDGGLLDATLEGQRFFENAAFDRMDIPVFLMYGQFSPYLKTGRMLAHNIPGAQFALGFGDHNLPVQQGKRIGRKLERFFAKQVESL